jgi:hypothetical protein
MALRARNLLELHHPAAGMLPRSSPRPSRTTPSTSVRVDATDTPGTSATTPDLPLILSRFMGADYRRASSDVSSRAASAATGRVYFSAITSPSLQRDGSRTCLEAVRDDMAKATASRRAKVDPKAKTEGAHQEGKFSIQTGQTDRTTKAKQKAGQVAFQKQDLPGERHPGKAASAPK